MPTSVKEDEKFLADVIGSELLEKSIEWIQNNLAPEDVFSEDALSDWANDHGFVEDE